LTFVFNKALWGVGGLAEERRQWGAKKIAKIAKIAGIAKIENPKDRRDRRHPRVIGKTKESYHGFTRMGADRRKNLPRRHGDTEKNRKERTTDKH